MEKNNWVRYKNGNYIVFLNTKNGTKIRYNKLDNFDAEFPESADVKITNRCVDPLGKGCGNCKYCHEGSGPVGEHSDAINSPIWDSFHPYTEISLGGGNPMEYPHLVGLLKKLRQRKLYPSITLHQTHFMEHYDTIKKMYDYGLIKSVGISLKNPLEPTFIKRVKSIPTAVIHTINGITSQPEYELLANYGLKVLILGYKEVRRGDMYYSSKFGKRRVDGMKQDLYDILPKMIEEKWFDTVSFDNLAIKQLDPQRLMSESDWSRMYMGDDGIDGEQTSASMYIDLVENIYAKNSCDVYHRRPIRGKTITEMYQVLKHDKEDDYYEELRQNPFNDD